MKFTCPPIKKKCTIHTVTYQSANLHAESWEESLERDPNSLSETLPNNEAPVKDSLEGSLTRLQPSIECKDEVYSNNGITVVKLQKVWLLARWVHSISLNSCHKGPLVLLGRSQSSSVNLRQSVHHYNA